jgi:AhpD family alkylhydroperoxidase
MSDNKQVLEDLREPVKQLRSHIPEVWTSFAEMHKHSMKEGELPVKTKELIALAIAVVKRCDGCIASHARGAVRSKATEQEVAEALGVALMMDGATATVYGPRAFEAYLQFKENS